MPNASGKAKVASVLKSTHVTVSCSLLLLSHDQSFVKHPRQVARRSRLRCDHLRAMTSCTQTTGEQATGEEATGEQAPGEQTTGEQTTVAQATSEQANAAVAATAAAAVLEPIVEFEGLHSESISM